MSIKKRLDRLEGGGNPPDGQGLAALLAIPTRPDLTHGEELEAYVAQRH